MAVTLTVPELAVAIGAGARQADGTITIATDQEEILTRQLSAVVAIVEGRAPGAPDAISNEAAVRLAGWLYDTDPAQLRFGSNPMLHSGAGALLAPWRQQTLVAPTGDVEPVTPGSGLPALPDARDAYLLAGDAGRLLWLTLRAAFERELYQEFVGGQLPLVGSRLVIRAVDGVTDRIRLGYEPPNGGGGKPDGGWTVADLAAAVVARLLPDGFDLSTLATDAELAAAVAGLATDAELAAAIAPLATTAALTALSQATAAALVARVPAEIPTPKSGTRGYVMRQVADGETFELAAVSTGGTEDSVARAAAAKAEADAQAASHEARDVQHLAEDNLAHIDALEDGGLLTTGYGAWALWTEAEWHAGFQLATGLSNTFRAEDFGPGSNTYSGVATNRRIAMSVPAGVDPARVRVRLTLNGAESFKPGAGEEWRAFTPTDANSRRDYYYLAVSSSGNHVVTTFSANDRVDLQIRPVVPVAGVTKRQVQAIQAAVQDVIVGDVVDHNWEAVKANGTEGGVTSAATTWTLDKAKAASYSAPSVNGAENESQIVRIPASADARHYRILIAGVGAELVNHFTRLGSDNNWQYYEQGIGLPDAAVVSLQVSDRALGHTTWAGALSDALMARMAPALAGNGGKFLAVNKGATAVELVGAPSGGGGGDPVLLATVNPNGGNAGAAIARIMNAIRPGGDYRQIVPVFRANADGTGQASYGSPILVATIPASGDYSLTFGAPFDTGSRRFSQAGWTVTGNSDFQVWNNVAGDGWNSNTRCQLWGLP